MLLRILAAALLAAPVGAIVWLELLYLVFGLTNEDASPAVSFAAAAVAFGGAFGWPLHGGARPAQVVQRACRLGIGASLLAPVVASVGLLLWEQAPGRAELGMGGLMLYSFPIFALIAGLLLAGLFLVVLRFADRRSRHPVPPGASGPRS